MTTKKKETKEETPAATEKKPDTVAGKNVWEVLSQIDCSDHTEQKNGLTYLSWAWAWGILKQYYPDSNFDKQSFGLENEKIQGKVPYCMDEAGNAFVWVTLNVGDQTVTEPYPVLDYNNKGVQFPDTFQVNTALQRGLTKCMAYLGLGHYIYAGEDLPQNYDPNKIVVDVVGPDKEIERAEGVEMIASVFDAFIGQMNDAEELTYFWKQNKRAIGVVKSRDPEKYEKVIGLFKKRRVELENIEENKK